MKFKLRPLRSLYLIIIMIISVSAYSQNAGISAVGATPPNPAAGLDINFSNKGLLLPRIALTSTTSFSPLDAHVAGMVIYNTTTTSDVTPGVYVDNGAAWVRTVLKEGTATADMQYWDNTNKTWVNIAIGTDGQKLKIHASGIPVWSN
jgi:hypothetical protein